MARDPSKQLVVYLIHFDPPYGKNRHYIGITTEDRIAARFAEHATGRGARMTAAAADAGCGFKLARLFPTDDPADEYRLLLRADEKHFCPVCEGKKPIREIQPNEKTAMHAWRSEQIELRTAASFAPAAPSSGKKKGRGLGSGPSPKRWGF
jgi:hypothetical protein